MGKTGYRGFAAACAYVHAEETCAMDLKNRVCVINRKMDANGDDMWRRNIQIVGLFNILIGSEKLRSFVEVERPRVEFKSGAAERRFNFK